jgi:hypothetical protein
MFGDFLNHVRVVKIRVVDEVREKHFIGVLSEQKRVDETTPDPTSPPRRAIKAEISA